MRRSGGGRGAAPAVARSQRQRKPSTNDDSTAAQTVDNGWMWTDGDGWEGLNLWGRAHALE